MRSVDEVIGCNKLQAHKSSFQAWKCVSFGCSLLAVVLLLSKWYEVVTDLQLLSGIERLLEQQQRGVVAVNGSAVKSLSWPPVPLEQLLPTINETGFGMESMESNGTMLMSHMQMSLNQEMNGNQLLREEVETFMIEFRNAKSTLGLSLLLVVVYLISWILMTLAINDTRISNDISLRNILLLSTFGAIDIAASVGFVMVRIIMYSVKNNPFAADLLESARLRDTPIRLSADQMTAFTAMRLIAMRSSSAFVDIYVSTVVSLLTLLRLYAILRALTYYRRLRKVSERESSRSRPLVEQKQIWSSSASFFKQPESGAQFAVAQPGATSEKAAHRRSSQQLNGSNELQYIHHQPPSYMTAPLMNPAALVEHHQMVPRVRPRARNAQPQPQELYDTRTGASLFIVPGKSATTRRQKLPQAQTYAKSNAVPDMLLVNGERFLRSDNSKQQKPASFNSTLPADMSFRSVESGGEMRGNQESDNLQNVFTLTHESSEQNLIAPEEPQRKQAYTAFNTIKSNGATYALLTADQLDQIGRKLLAETEQPSNRYKLTAKYRQLKPASLIARGPALLDADFPAAGERIQRNDSGLAADSSSSCEAPGDDSDDGSAELQVLRRKARAAAATAAAATTPSQQQEAKEELPQKEDSNKGQNFLLGQCDTNALEAGKLAQSIAESIVEI